MKPAAAKWGWVLLIAALVLGLGAIVIVRLRGSGTEPAVRPAPVVGIGALGTLAPSSRVRVVSAPGPAVRLGELLVEEGQEVRQGEVLARTDDHPLRVAELEAARSGAEVARAQLAQTRAGPKPGDVAALEAELAAARADLEYRKLDLRRREELVETKVVTEQDVDQRRLDVARGVAEVARVEARLTALLEVRDVDVGLRSEQLRAAEGNVAVAQAALDRTVIVAPITGRVLRVHARAGEQVPAAGILDLGDVRTMHAVAEVYEADVPRVRLGMTARVRVKSTELEFDGARVVAVGSRVGRKSALDNDPVTDTDARVVEVRVELSPQDSARVAGLTNARVEVLLHEQP